MTNINTQTQTENTSNTTYISRSEQRKLDFTKRQEELQNAKNEEKSEKQKEEKNYKKESFTHDKEELGTKIKLIGGGDGGVAIFNQLQEDGYDLSNSYLVLSSKHHQVNNPLKDNSKQFTMISTTDGMAKFATITQSILQEPDETGTCPLDVIMYDLLDSNGDKKTNLWVKVCTLGGGTDTAVSSELSAEVNDYNSMIDTEASQLEAEGKIGLALKKRTERIILINLVSTPYESDCDSRACDNLDYAEKNVYPSCNYMTFNQGDIAKKTGEDHSLVLPKLTKAVNVTLDTIDILYNYEPDSNCMKLDKSDMDSIFGAKGKAIFWQATAKDIETAYIKAFAEIREFDALADDRYCQNAVFYFEYKTKVLRDLAMINQETALKKNILKNAGSRNFLKYFHNYNPDLTDNVRVVFAITGINIEDNADSENNDSDIQSKAYLEILKENSDIRAGLKHLNKKSNIISMQEKALKETENFMSQEKDLTLPMTKDERNSKGGLACSIKSIERKIELGTATAEDFQKLYIKKAELDKLTR